MVPEAHKSAESAAHGRHARRPSPAEPGGSAKRNGVEPGTDASFRRFIEHAPIGIYRTTPDGRILLANPALVQMLGYASADDLAQNNLEGTEYAPTYDRRDFREHIERDGEIRGLESLWRRKDGSTIFVRENGRAVRDDDGRVLYYEGTIEDITERRRAEEALRFLAEASTILSGTLDMEATLERLAYLAVPQLADWCVIDVMDDEGAIRRVATAHKDPLKAEWARELQRRYPPDQNAGRGPPHVIRSGEPELLSELPPDLVEGVAQDPDHLRILREVGMESYMCVPLRARGRVLGAITFVSAESGRRYGARDLAFAEDLARRAALAADNARLFTATVEQGNALKQSEERLRTVVTGASLILWAIDRHGVFTLCSGKGLDLLGFKPEDLVGHSIFKKYADTPRVLENHRRALAGEAFTDIVEDHGVVFESRYSPVRDGYGRVTGVIGVSTDVTERHRAERRLGVQYAVARILTESHDPPRAVPELLRILCEGLDWTFGAMWMIDRGGARLRCQGVWTNPRHPAPEMAEAARSISFPVGAGLMTHVWVRDGTDWLTDDITSERFQLAQAAKRHGFQAGLFYPIQSGELVVAALEFFHHEPRNPDEESLRVLTTIASQLGQAVQRQRAESLLRARTHQQAVVAELGQEALTRRDLPAFLQGVAAAVATTLDVELAQILRLETEANRLLLIAGVGWNPGEIGAATVDAGRESQHGTVLLSSTPVIVEDLAKDDRFPASKLLREHDVRSGLSVLIPGSPRPWGVLGAHTKRLRRFTQDDSNFLQAVANVVASALEHHRAEEELIRHRDHLEDLVGERTAELTTANKELEAFSYSVSHDLRQPLRTINGFSQALLEEYGDQVGPDGRELLQRVRAGTQRMALLIDDLLKLSRVTRSELRREKIDLGAIAHSIIQQLRQRDPDRRVEFVVSGDLRDEGDIHLVRVMLENLLGNAWKFTSKHASARIEFTSASTESGKVYAVRDDGAGFDQRHVDRLFAPFQRLHRMTEFEGTGIGLATVQRILQRHGGRIWAEGAVEKGATFQFTLHGGAA